MLLLINKLYVSFNFMSEMSRDAGESRDSGKRQTDRETNSLKATTGAFFAVGVDVIKYQNNVYSQTKSSVPLLFKSFESVGSCRFQIDLCTLASVMSREFTREAVMKFLPAPFS